MPDNTFFLLKDGNFCMLELKRGKKSRQGNATLISSQEKNSLQTKVAPQVEPFSLLHTVIRILILCQENIMGGISGH